MALYRFEDREPTIDPTAYIAETALVIGDVQIGPRCYVGHGAILRGDYGTIVIGEGTAVEEAVIIHARPGDRTVVGKFVTIGHGAMLHNTTVHDNAVIGMRATVSDYSEVGEWAIIGEHSLVRNKQKVPGRVVAVGVPVNVVGPVTEDHETMWSWGKALYVNMAQRYKEPGAFVRID